MGRNLLPKISIVTPSFNQGQYIEQTILSVLNQNYPNLEYFIIDGCSTDNTVEIIKKYADRISYWVSEKDSGQAEAIAKGFSRATGDVLAWINSDDIYLPGAIAEFSAAFEAHPNWDALTAYHVRMDEGSRILTLHRIPAENPVAAQWGWHHVNQQTCFFKRVVYEKVGGMNLNQHCVLDTDLWLRMFEAGTTWGHIPKYLAGFRSHAAAKGAADSKWAQRYAHEEECMRTKFPQYCAANLKHRLGLMAYKARQILSGRHLRAAADIRKYRGKTLAEVFPPIPSANLSPIAAHR